MYLGHFICCESNPSGSNSNISYLAEFNVELKEESFLILKDHCFYVFRTFSTRISFIKPRKITKL
jgi:hypothetical protein